MNREQIVPPEHNVMEVVHFALIGSDGHQRWRRRSKDVEDHRVGLPLKGGDPDVMGSNCGASAYMELRVHLQIREHGEGFYLDGTAFHIDEPCVIQPPSGQCDTDGETR